MLVWSGDETQTIYPYRCTGSVTEILSGYTAPSSTQPDLLGVGRSAGSFTPTDRLPKWGNDTNILVTGYDATYDIFGVEYKIFY